MCVCVWCVFLDYGSDLSMIVDGEFRDVDTAVVYMFLLVCVVLVGIPIWKCP